MRDILLIIPAYNEEQSIVETVTAIRKFNRKRKRKVDFIVIDDGSTDRTAELLRLFHIPCIHMESNRGIGGAVQQGYRYAKEKNYKYASIRTKTYQRMIFEKNEEPYFAEIAQ